MDEAQCSAPRKAASSNATYSAECLHYAEALYAFSLANPGLGFSGGFYNSSGYVDKEAWAAAWLYVATGQASYLNAIVSTDSSGMDPSGFGPMFRR